jgi:hypothetical protein
VLRRMFGLKRNKTRGGWRNLHDDELYNFYSLPNINRNIKLRMK